MKINMELTKTLSTFLSRFLGYTIQYVQVSDQHVHKTCGYVLL